MIYKGKEALLHNDIYKVDSYELISKETPWTAESIFTCLFWGVLFFPALIFVIPYIMATSQGNTIVAQVDGKSRTYICADKTLESLNIYLQSKK